MNSSVFARRHLVERCILEGNIEGTKTLLDNGYGEGVDIMHTATLSSNPREMLRMLVIDYKYDPNEKDGRGYTPLFTAIDYDNYCVKRVVITLIELGADPHFEVCNNGVISTPYSRANEEIQDYIDSLGMDVKGAVDDDCM